MRVLVVDQDITMLERVARLLGDVFSVDTVSSKASCLDLLRQNEFEVVIATERLTDGSGLELLGQIARRWPQVRRIFAADAQRLALLNGRLAPFQLFRTVGYPLDADELMHCLVAAHQGGTDGAGELTVEHVEMGSEEPESADTRQPAALAAPVAAPRAGLTPPLTSPPRPVPRAAPRAPGRIHSAPPPPRVGPSAAPHRAGYGAGTTLMAAAAAVLLIGASAGVVLLGHRGSHRAPQGSSAAAPIASAGTPAPEPARSGTLERMERHVTRAPRHRAHAHADAATAIRADSALTAAPQAAEEFGPPRPARPPGPGAGTFTGLTLEESRSPSD